MIATNEDQLRSGDPDLIYSGEEITLLAIKDDQRAEQLKPSPPIEEVTVVVADEAGTLSSGTATKSEIMEAVRKIYEDEYPALWASILKAGGPI